MAFNQTSTPTSFTNPPSSATPSMTPEAVTALIIAKNEESMIANCIDTLRWTHEVIVLDTGSTDRTVELAKRAGARVEIATGNNFSQWRNQAAQLSTTPWVFYVDADERATPQLAKVIQSRIQRTDYDAYRIQRNNIMMGKWFQHGGWNEDQLLRLVRTDRLKGWEGRVHEHAEIQGRVGFIDEPLVHLTHRSVYDGLKKSIEWTDIEAQLFIEANHPEITPLRLFKIIIFDFLKRFFGKKAWKDGHEGTIEAMIQTMNRFLVYVRVWELQQKPSLPERYERIEQEIQKQWRRPA